LRVPASVSFLWTGTCSVIKWIAGFSVQTHCRRKVSVDAVEVSEAGVRHYFSHQSSLLFAYTVWCRALGGLDGGQTVGTDDSGCLLDVFVCSGFICLQRLFPGEFKDDAHCGFPSGRAIGACWCDFNSSFSFLPKWRIRLSNGNACPSFL